MATTLTQMIGNVEPINPWPQPDLGITREGIATPKFPKPFLGELAPVVEGLAVSGGTSVDFVAMSLLTVCASLIGSKRLLKPQVESDWKEPAILWTGLVCAASAGKSPALKPLTRILQRVQAEYLDEHQDAVREWRTDRERAKAEERLWEEAVAKAAKEGKASPALPVTAVEPKEPIGRRLFVNDVTQEALVRMLSGNPQGVVMIADELKSWFASFERYSSDSRGFWLTAYNGDFHMVDRKGSPEPIVLPFLGVSVLGGIQPRKLAETFKGSSDGLHSRLLWVWPDSVPYSYPTAAPDLGKVETVFRLLTCLPWGTDEKGEQAPLVLTLDRYASAVFEAFRKANIEERMDAPDSLLMNAVGKMPGQIVRLALTLELVKWALRGGEEPRQITGETMEAVCGFMSDYVRPMAEKVYGDADIPEAEKGVVALAKWIRRNRVRSFNASSDILKRKATHGFRSKEELKPVLEAMVDAGWLRAAGSRSGASKGRQSSDWLVNPAIHGGGSNDSNVA